MSQLTVKKVTILLPVNLQLFADDSKTEKATPKRREEARKKGNVPQSREASSAVVLVTLLVSLKALGPSIYAEIIGLLKQYLANAASFSQDFDINAVMTLYTNILLLILKVVGPLMVISLVTGFAVSLAQVGFLFTLETIKPNFGKINPASGLRRMFSGRAVFELVKSLIKLTITGYVAYSYIKNEADNILNLLAMDVLESGSYIVVTALSVALRISLWYLFLAALDYAYNLWSYERNLRMTKQEVREEYKELEGNPQIKSRIREKQRQMSMRRMLQEVPKADVVITNPTHYAVALKYDIDVSPAPTCVAKGQDYMALRIREIARENHVEIVENKPLARSLYASVEVGQAIPPELYQAVAEVLAFVYSLKGKVV